MTTIRRRKAINALALFLIFTVAQVYIQVNFAGPNANATASPVGQTGTPLSGKLTTKGNQPILVNGTSLSSGGTILSGATIDVPDGVGATIDLGPLGSIDLAPNTKVIVEFSDGQVRVRLVHGCVILRTKKGTSGQIDTEQGVAAQNDKNCKRNDTDQATTDNDGNDNNKKRCVSDVCFLLGSGAPTVNAGAAAAAGAGAGGGAAGAGGLFGLGTAATVGIIGGGIITTALIINEVTGDEPSPAEP